MIKYLLATHPEQVRKMPPMPEVMSPRIHLDRQKRRMSGLRMIAV